MPIWFSSIVENRIGAIVRLERGKSCAFDLGRTSTAFQTCLAISLPPTGCEGRRSNSRRAVTEPNRSKMARSGSRADICVYPQRTASYPAGAMKSLQLEISDFGIRKTTSACSMLAVFRNSRIPMILPPRLASLQNLNPRQDHSHTNQDYQVTIQVIGGACTCLLLAASVRTTPSYLAICGNSHRFPYVTRRANARVGPSGSRTISAPAAPAACLARRWISGSRFRAPSSAP